MRPPRLVLASTSPYRRALLLRLGVPFTVVAPGVDEAAVGAGFADPAARVLALAEAKACAGGDAGAVVLGSDQLVVLGAEILGKPGTAAAAETQLARLAGRTHRLLTAVAVYDRRDGALRTHLDEHRLTLRPLALEEIAAYVAADAPLDCAGSYKIESLGIGLMAQVEGDDFTAISGLPLIATRRLLVEAGVLQARPATEPRP